MGHGLVAVEAWLKKARRAGKCSFQVVMAAISGFYDLEITVEGCGFSGVSTLRG
jgi:hypothetical protein